MITGYKDKSEYTDKNGIRSVVYLMDNMEAMAQMKPKQYDLAIVDPPYGIDINPNMGLRKGKAKRHRNISWDSEIPTDDYFKSLFQVSLNQIIWGGNYFPLPPTKHIIFWDKLNPEGLSFSDGEIAWTSFNRAIRKWAKRNQGEGKIHPTQKPIELYEWVLKNYAKQGDTILDTHLGSGSSRIACYNRGFNFTGFEIDPDYFRDAEKRFRNHIKQQKLF